MEETVGAASYRQTYYFATETVTTRSGLVPEPDENN